ncbi:MAG: tryptophan halogenase, partial [Pseudomonadota bacterium]
SDERELFHNPSWIAVYLGQDIVPERAPAMTHHRDGVPVQDRLQAIRTAMAQAVDAMPTHETFIDGYCKSALQ